jgi:diguanylate cyclase (GGDEF)-like protein/PAS domain S-box-containing protein
MQNLVIEIVIAALLVFLLWSMERGRSDLRVRFWAIGWSLVLVYFLSLLWHPRNNTGIIALFRQAHFAGLEVIAGVCFILSDPALVRHRRRMIRVALLGTLPALFTGYVILFHPTDLWVLYFSVVVSHLWAIDLLRKYVGQRKSKFLPLATLYFCSAVFMLVSLAFHKPQLVLASIPAELFLINAVLFARNYSLRDSGNLIAVTGFVLWSWSSFFMIAMRHSAASDALFPQFLNLPQFLVAIGMAMIVIEQDAAVSRELVREYQVLFNNNPFPLWIYDLKSLRFLSANPASAKAHGYTVDELRRKRVTDLVHPNPGSQLPLDIKAGSVSTQQYSLHTRKDGTTVPMNVTAYDVRFRGRAARIVLAEDTSEREQMALQLMYQVQHDLLTGLPNRETFVRKLDEIFISATCSGLGCAAIVFRINRFDRINETYGHGVGDGVLKETARLLQSQIRGSDTIGRTGSREYTIALAAVKDGAAAEVKARGLLKIFDQPITVGEHSIEVSVCMGLAVYPEDSDDANGLLRDAARARARAQIPGADKLVRLSRELSLQAQEEGRIESLIRQALLHQTGFEVFYQPILNIHGELSGLEALLRLRDADGMLVSPSAFIPIAESTGGIIPIGRWVIREVCRQLKEWQDNALPVVSVAINVSALQIVQTTFCADVTAILREFHLDSSLVHLELTESSVMPHDSLALNNMLELSAEGIRFSIDDFGTGFSSLDRLHQLPVSILKIDRSFVTRMLDANGTLPIVTTIISMAHSLNLGVVAEGVESKEQFNALYEMGCDLFQGFYFCRPINASATAKLLSGDSHTLPPTVASTGSEGLATKPLGAFPAAQSDTHRW